MKLTRHRLKSQATKKPVNNTDFSQVLKKMQSVSELSKHLKALFIGRAGSGKTTTLATFPKPILILDFREEGTDSISDLGDEVKVIKVEDADEIEQIYWYLKSGDHPFKTVAWENLGQAQRIFMIKSLEEEGKSPEGHANKGTWGNTSGKIQTWVMNYRELPMHFVMTSHPRITESEEDDETQLDPEVGPGVMPSVARMLTGAVDVIGQNFIREVVTRSEGKIKRRVEYAMRLGPHAYYVTKIRKPKNKGITPEFIVDPEFETLIQIKQGLYGGESVKKKTKKKGSKK